MSVHTSECHKVCCGVSVIFPTIPRHVTVIFPSVSRHVAACRSHFRAFQGMSRCVGHISRRSTACRRAPLDASMTASCRSQLQVRASMNRIFYRYATATLMKNLEEVLCLKCILICDLHTKRHHSCPKHRRWCRRSLPIGVGIGVGVPVATAAAGANDNFPLAKCHVVAPFVQCHFESEGNAK